MQTLAAKHGLSEEEEQCVAARVTNSQGITGGARARGLVEFVSVSTGRTEDAGNLGEEDCSRGLPQPSADEMPSLQMAPPGRHPGRSRNDRDTSLSKTQTDNESERPRNRYSYIYGPIPDWPG